jgi:hypothetical protein
MSDQREAITRILAGHTPEVQALVAELRELIRAAVPALKEEGKTGTGNIHYSYNGVVCAIAPHKQHVNLHFYKGTRLSDPEGLLEGGGRALRHVKIRNPEDISVDTLTQMVQEAYELNVD